MADTERREDRDPWLEALGRFGPALLGVLAAFEHVERRLHPPELPGLRQSLAPCAESLSESLTAFAELPPPSELSEFAGALRAAGESALEAARLFLGQSGGGSPVEDVLAALRARCRAQELLFPLRRGLPPVNQWFLEPAVWGLVDQLDPEPSPSLSVGLHRAAGADSDRGGFHLYVPESYRGDRPWPLVVALHGGFGHGRDFLWTWLREARSRQFLLLAPTSRGSTWSFGGLDVDGPALRSMVARVCDGWRVDAERVLLTGLSDGATYTLVCGLQEDSPFTALAPVSGVLHPINFANGNLSRAEGRRIYWAHGALDWMFPVALAREACERLREAGARLVYDEVADLSHAYPRERNAAILTWFASELALSEAST
ncbi:MAG: phospholipase [Proteobacteria bacterium]|nr:phospholipase [Pseudomonadota bacterium]